MSAAGRRNRESQASPVRKDPVAAAARRLRSLVDSATERVRDAVRSRRNAEREFRPIFVAGAIGSGTSLLAISLAQRFQVAGIATESARQIDPGSILWVDRVYRYPTIRAYTDVLHPRPDWTPARVREDLLALYRAKAEHDSAEAFVDKGPNVNLVRARLLLEAFPSAHFLLIFRDPVANVEGFRRKWQVVAHAVGKLAKTALGRVAVQRDGDDPLDAVLIDDARLFCILGREVLQLVDGGLDVVEHLAIVGLVGQLGDDHAAPLGGGGAHALDAVDAGDRLLDPAADALLDLLGAGAGIAD